MLGVVGIHIQWGLNVLAPQGKICINMHKETKDILHHIQIVKKETPLVENHCMCEGHSMSFKDQFGEHAHKYAHAHT